MTRPSTSSTLTMVTYSFPSRTQYLPACLFPLPGPHTVNDSLPCPRIIKSSHSIHPPDPPLPNGKFIRTAMAQYLSLSQQMENSVPPALVVSSHFDSYPARHRWGDSWHAIYCLVTRWISSHNWIYQYSLGIIHHLGSQRYYSWFLPAWQCRHPIPQLNEDIHSQIFVSVNT